MNTEKAVTTLGESALTGWRGRVGGAVARPIGCATQRAAGPGVDRVALLVYVLYRFLRPTITALRSTD